MNDEEKIEKALQLIDDLENMIRFRNKEIHIKAQYDPTEILSIGEYLTLIDKSKKILES